VDLCVVIPTRDRRGTVCETLGRLARQEGDVRLELKVVDDGSTDGTPDAVRRLAEAGDLDLELLEQPGRGPAAARNRALERARAPVCLFLNDDSLPRPGLVARHAAFHARRPEREAALLGAIVLPERPAPTEFMRWSESNHFDFAGIDDPHDVGGARFFTANVSAKTELLRAAGGFDESFRDAANEDVELGLRLDALGLRLEYDPAAIVEHDHPLDLAGAIERYRRSARSLVPLVERHPDWPTPRRPGARHRAKAAALTALTAAGVRAPALRREVWRFLCHEAAREGYWAAAEGGEEPRIGARLARRAVRDPDARLPEGAASG
jgi:glycosyltransferase involved in cell wall biosynthesis